MRLLMLPAQVTLRDHEPATVNWQPPSPDSSSAPSHAAPPGGTLPFPAGARHSSRPATSRPPSPIPRTVVQVLDHWRYDGRWWDHEVHRDYYLLELQGGTTVELFHEGDAWWAARTSD